MVRWQVNQLITYKESRNRINRGINMAFLQTETHLDDGSYILNVNITSGTVQINCSPDDGADSFNLYDAAISVSEAQLWELPDCTLTLTQTDSTVDAVPKRTR